MAIYSIGLNNFDEEKFVKAMRNNKVEYLVDVRNPSVKSKQWCLPKSLKMIADKNGIRYLCWINKVWLDFGYCSCSNAGQYLNKFKSNTAFLSIINRILDGAKNANILLSCSHGRTEKCIINNVIAVLLEENNTIVHCIEIGVMDIEVNPPLFYKHMNPNRYMLNDSYWHDNELQDWWR